MSVETALRIHQAEASAEHGEDQAFERLQTLLPSSMEEAGQKVDWNQVNQLLEQIESGKDLVAIYNQLAGIMFEDYGDHDDYLASVNFNGDYSEFIKSLPKKVAQTEAGFDLLVSELQKEEVPHFFYNYHSDSFESETHGTDYHKSVLIKSLFQADPEKALESLRGYLAKLDQWREQNEQSQVDDEADYVENLREGIEPNVTSEDRMAGFDASEAEYEKDQLKKLPKRIKEAEQNLAQLEDAPEATDGQLAFARVRLEALQNMQANFSASSDDPEPYKYSLEYAEMQLMDFEHYPGSTRVYLECLSDYGKEGQAGEADIDTLISYLKDDLFATLHLKEVKDVFEKIDVNYSSRKLLEIVQDTDGNPYDRRLATNLLYRLEFGRIGISEQGVEYLESMYDVGEYNNPENFAQRLTRDGDIGIFDHNRELAAYFNLGDLSDRQELIRAKILSFTYETLFTPQADESPEQREEREKILKEFQEKYFDFFDDRFFQDTGVAFNNLSFKEQGHFMYFVENAGDEKKEKALDMVKKYGENGLRTFLAVEYGIEMGDVIINLGESLPLESAKRVYQSYLRVIDYAYEQALILRQEIQNELPHCQITDEDILHGFFMRGRDLLVELNDNLGESPDDNAELVSSFIKELKSETDKQKLERAYFKKITDLFSQENVNLEKQTNAQAIVLKELMDSNNTGLLLRVLQRMGHLKPIPEIHWRVDRRMEEYDRYFGFDTLALLKDLASDKDQEVLLEFGPGSGISKRERAFSPLRDKYQDYAMADRLYYPLQSAVEKMIDFDKIQQALGVELSGDERTLLSEFIYKCLYIKEGQTARDDFEYDQETIDQITADPNNVKDLLATIGLRLSQSETIPQTISTRDNSGNVIYPYKTEVSEQSVAFQEAFKAFAEHPSDFLIDDIDSVDVYNLIEAFPPGVMIGDFSEIKKIESNQIDKALGVRSTVYLKGEKYVEFLGDLVDKLNSDGIYVADCVRDNDGWYYRLAEVLEFKNRLAEKKDNGGVDFDINVSVILGPGFPGEDHRQELVPSALVVSKNKDYTQTIASKLKEGYEIVPFEELVSAQGKIKYDIAGLDSTGHTLERLNEVQGASSPDELDEAA